MSTYELNPELAAIHATLPAGDSFPHDPHAMREFFRNYVNPTVNKYWAEQLPQASEYRVDDHKVPVDGGEIVVRCLTPTPTDATGKMFPLVCWFLGSGWTIGDIDTDDLWLRIICVELQVVIINPGCRLCPEHSYTVGHNDAYAAVKWAAENASKLSVDLSKGFILMGLSSSGGTVAALTHRARDDSFFATRPLTGQLLMEPVTCHEDAYPEKYKAELRSVKENADAPFYNVNLLHVFYGIAKPDPYDPNFSPLLYPSHRDLPPAYFQICGLDPLRDEGLVYAKALTEAGVKTKIDFYPGCPHGYHVGLPSLKISQKFDGDTKKGLRWLLSQTDS